MITGPALQLFFSTSDDIRCISINFYTSGYDDKYHAITAISGTKSVGKARSAPTRTLVPNANIPALSNLGAGCPMTNLKIGMDAKSLRHMGVRMNSNVCTSSDARWSLH